MSTNTNLISARINANDEFYTLYEDIESELSHYTNEFKGKTIYCNCDNPYKSNFVKYFINNFNKFGLRELYATCYHMEQPKALFSFDNESQKEAINDKPYKLHVTNVENFDGNDIDEIVKLDGNSLEVLKWNGSYDSKECIEILKKCDIVVTNPPFSVFRKYMRTLFKYKVHYIILGAQHSITYKPIFDRLKDGRLWLGYHVGVSTDFVVNNDYDKIKTERDGIKYGAVAISWYTNVQQDFQRPFLNLTKKYSETEYKKYDNYNAINVNKSRDIPMDYDGLMGVPISFLAKWCPEQFEIVGIDAYMEDNPNYGKRFDVDGNETFARIIIRRKMKVDNEQ